MLKDIVIGSIDRRENLNKIHSNLYTESVVDRDRSANSLWYMSS